MKIDVAETEIMKWIFAMKEDFIAAAGGIQADVTETKPLVGKFLIGKLVEGKGSREPKQFGLMRKTS